MSSCMCKVMERMINERIMWLAEKKEWFDKTQNGFRRGRLCFDNLSNIIADVKISQFSGKKIVAAFLDVSSVYDNVLRGVLIKILKESGCPRKIVRFIQEWMKERKMRFITHKGIEIEKMLNRRLPQGGERLISPILYSLYTSNITTNLQKEVQDSPICC